LQDAGGAPLDSALVLWFPGPDTATGEDLAELHCHGGRAVIVAVEGALTALQGLRRAEAGEFTRRAFANGRLDLAEAEGLADLLSAETELQRAAALHTMQGALSRQVEAWRERVLVLSAQLEAVLDFSDEEDASDLPEGFTWNIAGLAKELGEWLTRPRAERLGEGFRVVLAGPPNAGKSTLFNALVESEAAITSPIAGTTRDVIERSVAIAGVPFTFVDTAGLRDDSRYK
jgi:tRNA modification GTPase